MEKSDGSNDSVSSPQAPFSQASAGPKIAGQVNCTAETLRSAHLYQLNAYLDNLSSDPSCEAMLLYPTVDKALSASYTHKGHKISIRTINLNQSWQAIHDDLLRLVA